MNKIAYFYPNGHEAHFKVGHPERPERIEVIRSGLKSAGYWEKAQLLDATQLPDDVLFNIHTPEYIYYLRSISKRGGQIDADTYTTPSSFKLAINAAMGAIAVAEDVWEKNDSLNGNHYLKGFALTRPPGHHATADMGMGFCLLNNISLVAEYLKQKENANRLAIVDLDLHHGNGTQQIFWERNDVFYISTHQYPWYPGTGNLDEIGSGKGEGYNANFPLPPGTGDSGFITIMEEFIIPILDYYQPEMILVSFGFDTHWRDPLGQLQLTGAGYGKLIKSLSDWADDNCSGKITLLLEGGYDLEAAKICSQSVVAALLNVEFVDYLGAAPCPEGRAWLSMVKNARMIWNV